MNSAGNLVFSWQYVSFGVPDALKGVSQQVWEQEREKAAQRMAEASCEIQQVLRESMARLVQHMADRLKETPDGKPVRFKESTVSNLVEFLANFEFRNVTDDQELQQLVAKARDLLQGLRADDLRTTGDLRTRVQQGHGGNRGRTRWHTDARRRPEVPVCRREGAVTADFVASILEGSNPRCRA